jgi:membrane protease YdiL (CAAX protease family)
MRRAHSLGFPFRLRSPSSISASVRRSGKEVIFRGLLQSVLARSFALREASAHAGPLTVALLFGASHLVVGPVTAGSALLLGIVAGEFRLRSASLLPAVIMHALFNLSGMFWPQA